DSPRWSLAFAPTVSTVCQVAPGFASTARASSSECDADFRGTSTARASSSGCIADFRGRVSDFDPLRVDPWSDTVASRQSLLLAPMGEGRLPASRELRERGAGSMVEPIPDGYHSLTPF